MCVVFSRNSSENNSKTFRIKKISVYGRLALSSRQQSVEFVL